MPDPKPPLIVSSYLQAALDAMNEAEPPDYDVPPFLANFRHPCTGARQSKKLAGKGVSTAVMLREGYLTVGDVANGSDQDLPPHLVEAAEDWAMIYREGRCRKCGSLCRSTRARFVRTTDRPPVTGRVARQ